MHLKRGLRAVRAFFGHGHPPTRSKLPPEEAQRTFRHIWHYLQVGSDRHYPLKRGQTNALVLQMSKVASTSIQAALCQRGINAFHSHSLSSSGQHALLSALLEQDLSFRLAAHELRRHIQHVAMHMMIRWYRQHMQYKGRRLKVITLTRDPITHYPSGFLHRRDSVREKIFAWSRARSNLDVLDPIDAEQAMSSFVMELASIIAEGRPSTGLTAHGRCIALAMQRWPEHPVVADEVGTWLSPLSWFENEITPVFGLDMLAATELRDQGWAERSNEWVDILVLKFEALSSLIPEIRRFFDLPELALPRENVASAKAGAAEIAVAMRLALDTPVGQACVRELRTSPYGLACGYDRLT
jgi:hypothetical protein